MKKVSVIVPVYNVEKYLDKCLNTLVNQSLDDIEIIVVNDGSPDNSQMIVDNYVTKYPNKVRSIIKKNGGQGSARNLGLQYALGEYIGYVDSDDYVYPEMFEKLYNQAIKDNSDVVICENYTLDEVTGVTTKETCRIGYVDDFSNAWFGKLAVWNKLFKKELLIENELMFPENIWYEDAPFTCKNLLLAKKISFVEEPLYFYLIRQGSTMNNKKLERNLDIIPAFEEIREFIKENQLTTQYYERFVQLAILHLYLATSVRVIVASTEQIQTRVILEKIQTYYKACTKGKKIDLKFLDKNKKIIYFLLKQKQYALVRLLFKLKG